MPMHGFEIDDRCSYVVDHIELPRALDFTREWVDHGTAQAIGDR